MSNFEQDIQSYIDPQTGMVALQPNTDGRSCDNHLLFTATASRVFGYPSTGQLFLAVHKFRLATGSYTRYPGDPEPSSWDDHLGLAVAHPELAKEILDYAYGNDWTWNSAEGTADKAKWLGRIPLFVPTVLAAAGTKLSLFNQIRAAVCFVQNTFEKREETSGMCLLFLAQHAFKDQGIILDIATRFWRWRSNKKYPNGMKDVYGIYFKDHPFTNNAPVTFDTVAR